MVRSVSFLFVNKRVSDIYSTESVSVGREKSGDSDRPSDDDDVHQGLFGCLNCRNPVADGGNI